ncbi:MAG: asparagine synthase (glutamine-hydrolyzing) [Candidatus Promineifilaceae bacterium]
MCGIVGTCSLAPGAPVSETQLSAMLHAIRHRGPDEFGIYTYDDGRFQVGLGSARLAIIDLQSGQQPIGNENGRFWIVFNGEIYNYIELRPALAAKGHHLQTDSDTEVILHLYEEDGPDCLTQLNGQFAIAIWDEVEKALFLARDRVGIRPLYYTIQHNTLLFASEIKALLADDRVPARLNPQAVDQIFTYWSPVSPYTPFEGIYTLPPGHWLKVDRNGRLHQQPYWQPNFPHQQKAHLNLSVDEAASHLRQLLIDATQIRLRADVPVGAYLSGGLDSSAITALIHHYTDRKLETFSIAFTDTSFDESRYQQQMARHLGTNHHIITCTPEEIGQAFYDVIRHTETPILRTSPAPLFLLSRLVHSHRFKVVLTGEGADEFLGGYNIFRETAVRRFWARQPQSTLRPQLLRKLYPYVAGLDNDAYLRHFFGLNLTNTDDPTYSHALRWHNTRRCRRFFHPDFAAALPETAVPTLPPHFANWTPLAKAQFLEITLFMAEYLLSSQGDRVAMAHSVEGRFPFLDHRIMDFSSQLPPHYKIRGLNEKFLLKQAVQDLLPPEIGQRAKRPYRAPIHTSFFPNNTPLAWVQEMVSPVQIKSAGVFNETAVQALIRKTIRLDTLSETDQMALTGILSTQLVHHHFIANRPKPPLLSSVPIKRIHRAICREP